MFKIKYFIVICCFLSFFACKEEVVVTFLETNITFKNNHVVDINVPKAQGNDSISKHINNIVENTLIKALHTGNPDEITSKSLKESVSTFNAEYNAFKRDFPISPIVWEAQIDGEVILQNQDIISVALTSYINTGGAHGILLISLLNFDAQTGKKIKNETIFSDLEGLKKVAKSYFDKEIAGKKENYFEPNTFRLPSNIGFNEEGALLIYNAYEIAPYSTGITEITIPYTDINSFLVFKNF